ncbi:MAG: uracil-DNA glycosylase [Herbaspirillum sp.]
MIPVQFLDAITLVHPSWQPTLHAGLVAIVQQTPTYLPLLAEADYLPTAGRLFAAFRQPLDQVRYVLMGEGPYPRAASAIGVCFMDGAVDTLWSAQGLSKPVNRATSLRNFIKMLLVASGALDSDHCSGDALAPVAATALAEGADWIQTLFALQHNLENHGFLLLNATLVYRSDVRPVHDAQAWRPFMQVILTALAQHAERQQRTLPTLVLWGKIAEALKKLDGVERFPKAISVHPYNLSFITNPVMQSLFGPLRLLRNTG